MPEPDFISQNGEKLSVAERRDWFIQRRIEAQERGARHHRYTVHPTESHLILYEGWTATPYVEKDGVRVLDEGEPRWQFSSVTTPIHGEDRGN